MHTSPHGFPGPQCLQHAREGGEVTPRSPDTGGEGSTGQSELDQGRRCGEVLPEVPEEVKVAGPVPSRCRPRPGVYVGELAGAGKFAGAALAVKGCATRLELACLVP